MVSDPWRCSTNGGINALYCYLRINQVRCEYSDLLREQPGDGSVHSVATLAQLASAHGLPLQPVSLTWNELSHCSMPVVVHMDGESPEAGAFLLLLGATDNSIDYVNGPTATIHKMSRADFCRVWSGIALLPLTPVERPVLLYAIGCGIGLAGSALFRCRRILWFP
jgi:ABC-type bacteriocin/lantibiotic exporter with double-glycine peptidase domain